MLRTIDEDQGIGIYTRELIPRLLDLDRDDEFVLIYRTPRYLGRFADRSNVREVLIRAPGKLLWDQVAVPWIARKHGLDVIFHPKFTVPVLSGRRTRRRLPAFDDAPLLPARPSPDLQLGVHHERLREPVRHPA
jgi:hypothetical protein